VATYLAASAAGAICSAGLLALSGLGLGSIPAVIGLALVAAVSEWRGTITLRGNLTVSISLFPSVFAAVLFGPLAGMAVFGASAIGLRIPLAGRLLYGANR